MPGVRDTINCSFSACRGGIRKCWQWVQCHKPLVFVLQDQYNVLCLGLTGSGKSTLLYNLTENKKPFISEPTNGFYIKTMPIRNIILCIKEIGGSERLQQYWNQYFEDKQAILFVVNCADSEEKLLIAKDKLRTVLANDHLKDQPCLILGTHGDLPEARSDAELEKIFTQIMQNRKWSVHCCCAFDRDQIINRLEILIDMMLSSS